MRGRRREVAFALVALLALPAVTATSHQTPEWDEVAGGPGRTGAAFLPSATLDVLWAGELFRESQIFLARSKGLVSTPQTTFSSSARGHCRRGAVQHARRSNNADQGTPQRAP